MKEFGAEKDGLPLKEVVYKRLGKDWGMELLLTYPCSFHHAQSSAEPLSTQSAPGERDPGVMDL